MLTSYAMPGACSQRIAVPIVTLLAWLLTGAPPATAGLGPQSVVRRFCQIDGFGQRTTIRGWTAVAALVTWEYEPAWDRMMLISGYEIGSPQLTQDGVLTVEVRYQVVGEVSALGVDNTTFVEAANFRVQDEGGWRIAGPPVPPHVFRERVDVDGVRRSIERGGVNFIANSLFIWQMFQTAGWNVIFNRTGDLLSGASYRVVDQPKPGDVVAYLRDGSPYHVGLLEAEDQVVSSTLNAGIVRATTNAFPGEVKYLRLVQSDANPDVAPAPERPASAVAGQRTRPSSRPRGAATASRRRKQGTKMQRAVHPIRQPSPTKPARPKSGKKASRPAVAKTTPPPDHGNPGGTLR